MGSLGTASRWVDKWQGDSGGRWVGVRIFESNGVNRADDEQALCHKAAE